MERLTMTPFGRQPVSAGLLASQALAETAADAPEIDKWTLFRELCVARRVFAISDRDLTVLNALLSFARGAGLAGTGMTIVFPSNRALGARAHGMADSTLRRHLAALVGAGLIARHDSPNGKRYARRGAGGTVERAFGFDLSPLALRADEILRAASAVREAEEGLRRLRESCSLKLRDAAKLIEYGREERPGQGAWDALDDRLRLTRRALRRKLSRDELEALDRALDGLGQEVRETVLGQEETKEMSANDADIERHQQNSNPEPTCLEPCQETGRADGDGSTPPVPLALVVKACPEMEIYADSRIENWSELVRTAAHVRGMMGISASAWEEACQAMGPGDAAVAVACILERIDTIRSAGGYLRALSRKAAEGAFSTGPMVMAQLRARTAQAA